MVYKTVKHTIETNFSVGEVHFYTFEKDEHFIMVDTGPKNRYSFEYYSKFIDLSKLTHLFITHCHIDHYGMLDYISENSDCKIYLSKYDILKFKYAETRYKKIAEILSYTGFPDDLIDIMSVMMFNFKKSLPFPKGLCIEENKDNILKEIGVDFVRCYGHTQSDLIYLIDNWAVSGDAIIREIFQTPLLDISLDDLEQRFSNYKAFCQSAIILKSLENRVFLPGHRDYIDSIEERLIFYIDKILTRAVMIRDQIYKNSIYKLVASIVSDPYLDPFRTYIKASEVFFMKDVLMFPELIFSVIKQLDIENKISYKINDIV